MVQIRTTPPAPGKATNLRLAICRISGRKIEHFCLQSRVPTSKAQSWLVEIQNMKHRHLVTWNTRGAFLLAKYRIQTLYNVVLLPTNWEWGAKQFRALEGPWLSQPPQHAFPACGGQAPPHRRNCSQPWTYIYSFDLFTWKIKVLSDSVPEDVRLTDPAEDVEVLQALTRVALLQVHWSHLLWNKESRMDNGCESIKLSIAYRQDITI